MAVSFDDSKRDFPPVVPKGRKESPFDDVYHSILTARWWAFALGVAGTFVVANALFAVGYLLEPGSVTGARAGSFEDSFFFSVQTMATIGYGTMAPASFYAHVLVTIEALVGMLGMALVTGLTFAKFSRPTARVLFARKVVIGPRDGVTYLMFRMGNWRRNLILEANLRIYILLEEISKEGHAMRRPYDLKLVRSNTAMFSMTWTAMHVIDETSPFHGEDALEKLRTKKAEIFLVLNGIDETFAQPVYARHNYRLDDIEFGAQFADVLSVEPDGTRVIDYARFHEVVRVSSGA